MVEMLRNPLQAAACSYAVLTLFLMQSSLLHCSVDANVQRNLCPKTLWRIDFNNSFKRGEADLIFDVPYQDKGGGLYEAIVECGDLVIINSTGHQLLRIRKDVKNIVRFGIRAPSPKDDKLTEDYGKDKNHTCTFELRHETMALTKGKRAHIECQFTVRTLLNRILPNCNLERSKGLIEKIEVLKDVGQVQLEFKSSPNDVVTTDSSCETGNIFGHNKTQELEDEMFGLNLPGLFTSTIVLEFDPACDEYNETLRKIYSNQRMEDCYYEVYAMCQEGMLSIKDEKVEFDDEVMYCHPPKSGFSKAMEQLELKFRIESKPVVLLIIILITNAALYVALIPFLIAKFARASIHKYRRLNDKLGRLYRRYRHPKAKEGGTTSQDEHAHKEIPKQWSISMPAKSDDVIESNRSSELGMEYDDVETILLGKLSAKDLEGIEPGEEHVSLQFEVEADVEPVKEQPYLINLEDKEKTPKLKKRRKSSLKHDPDSKHHRHRDHKKKHEDDHRQRDVHRHRKHERSAQRMDAPSRPLPLPPSPPPPPPVTPTPQTITPPLPSSITDSLVPNPLHQTVE